MTATFRPSRGIGRSSRRLACVALLAALPLTACAAGYQAETSRERVTLTSVTGAIGHLTLRNIFLVGPTDSGGDVPLYMAIFNGGVDTDTLLSISSADATGAYVPAGATTIDPLGSRYYNDGDAAVPQLTGLKRNLLVGQTVSLKLVFQSAGELDITVPVIAKETDEAGSSLPTPSAVPSATATPAASATVTPSAAASSDPSAPESATPSPGESASATP